MPRLLILSCSQRKRSDPGCLPAIERYDGPPYYVLRKYLRSQPVDPPNIYVLSAEFGLIAGDYPIPWYDRRMTVDRANELQTAVRDTLHEIFDDASAPIDPNLVLVCLGKDYWQAMAGYKEPAATTLTARIVSGGQGRKLTQLRNWLNDERPPRFSRGVDRA